MDERDRRKMKKCVALKIETIHYVRSVTPLFVGNLSFDTRLERKVPIVQAMKYSLNNRFGKLRGFVNSSFLNRKEPLFNLRRKLLLLLLQIRL